MFPCSVFLALVKSRRRRAFRTASHDARALRRHLAHLQVRRSVPVHLDRADAVELARVVGGRRGDVVEPGGDAAVQAEEAREVGEEARGLVPLDFAVLDRGAA